MHQATTSKGARVHAVTTEEHDRALVVGHRPRALCGTWCEHVSPRRGGFVPDDGGISCRRCSRIVDRRGSSELGLV